MSSNVMNRLLIARKHLSSQGTFFIPLPVIVLYHVGPFRKILEKGATILFKTLLKHWTKIKEFSFYAFQPTYLTIPCVIHLSFRPS